jgi:predicted TIM-barrel fold metal-dependent hydrolase
VEAPRDRGLYNTNVTRRSLLAAGATAAYTPIQAAPAPPVLDTHIHLFDPTRAEGVPWPAKTDTVLYRPALPARLRAEAQPFGVLGAIEIECSPLVEDNQWVLDVAARDPFIVGMVGNLEPAAKDFPALLERFHRNPLFLGVRYGNLWGRDLAAQLGNPAFVAGLRAVAAAGLTLDTANPDPKLLEAILRATDAVPELRVVLDHMPRLASAPDGLLKDLGARPRIYAKLSGVLRRVDGKTVEEPAFYGETLDRLCAAFGENRVLFGSDWPNSDKWGTYAQGYRVVREYFAAKGMDAARKYFWTNSAAAYGWKPREAAQKRPGDFPG